MGLCIDQTKKLLELYLTGMSVTEIALQMRVALAEIQSFIPTGSLNVAYQKSIMAQAKVDAEL